VRGRCYFELEDDDASLSREDMKREIRAGDMVIKDLQRCLDMQSSSAIKSSNEVTRLTELLHYLHRIVAEFDDDTDDGNREYVPYSEEYLIKRIQELANRDSIR
jgi:hypothetical protein